MILSNTRYIIFHIIVVRLQKGVIMAKKTLDSQIKAVRKYESEREVLRVVVPKGTKGGYQVMDFLITLLSTKQSDGIWHIWNLRNQ